jgi:HB1, ASXL, restriction endonuclease HTH domain
MATKKHSKRTVSDKPPTGRQTKDDKTEAVPLEASTPAELAPVEAAEAASVPTPERTRIDTPVPTEPETAAPDQIVPNQPESVKKLSALDAAVRVLEETGQAMNCAELIAAMAARGYWSSPKGRTPAGTLYSAVLREIQTKGDQARFRKTERGKFALRENT